MIDYTKESKLSVKPAVEKMQTMEIMEIMEKTFDSESNDIALYLAMSKQAEEEGQNEIAAYLFNIAICSQGRYRRKKINHMHRKWHLLKEMMQLSNFLKNQ